MMTPKRRLYIWEYISKSSSASPTVKPEQLADVLTIEKCCSRSSICFKVRRSLLGIRNKLKLSGL